MNTKTLQIISYSTSQVIGGGARLAIEECQNQFSMSRWNCTTFLDKNNTFGNVATIRK